MSSVAGVMLALIACTSTAPPTEPLRPTPTGTPAVTSNSSLTATPPSVLNHPSSPTPPEPAANPSASPAAPGTATRPAPALTAAPTAPAASPTAAPTRPPPAGHAIVVNHGSIVLFEQIPEQYIQAAAALTMMFSDRSVGGNISEGLDCLSYDTDEDARHHCQWGQHPDPAFTVDPSEVNWDRPGGYPRDNWVFEYRQGSWQDLTAGFVQDLAPGFAPTTTVLSYQFSYLNVDSGSDIADPQHGFFVPQPTGWDVSDVDALAAQYPGKVFFYWTTSLARSIGTAESDAFNDQMRAYAAANGKILFDVADILSHDPGGNPCFDSRDGIAFSNGRTGENFPDDGHAYRAICQHYTTEIEGGHLGAVSAGKIRVAKAFWVLMAQIAGWRP
ncbi:MAG: hypothetical protein IT318_01240 [Anaerolineales bacterium]|nr:hypothetical protein [Anaerolineales bacterium]